MEQLVIDTSPSFVDIVELRGSIRFAIWFIYQLPTLNTLTLPVKRQEWTDLGPKVGQIDQK